MGHIVFGPAHLSLRIEILQSHLKRSRHLRSQYRTTQQACRARESRFDSNTWDRLDLSVPDMARARYRCGCHHQDVLDSLETMLECSMRKWHEPSRYGGHHVLDLPFPLRSSSTAQISTTHVARLLWCGRFLDLGPCSHTGPQRILSATLLGS